MPGLLIRFSFLIAHYLSLLAPFQGFGTKGSSYHRAMPYAAANALSGLQAKTLKMLLTARQQILAVRRNALRPYESFSVDLSSHRFISSSLYLFIALSFYLCPFFVRYLSSNNGLSV